MSSKSASPESLDGSMIEPDPKTQPVITQLTAVPIDPPVR